MESVGLRDRAAGGSRSWMLAWEMGERAGQRMISLTGREWDSGREEERGCVPRDISMTTARQRACQPRLRLLRP